MAASRNAVEDDVTAEPAIGYPLSAVRCPPISLRLPPTGRTLSPLMSWVLRLVTCALSRPPRGGQLA
jgi:hypothetical protein